VGQQVPRSRVHGTGRGRPACDAPKCPRASPYASGPTTLVRSFGTIETVVSLLCNFIIRSRRREILQQRRHELGSQPRRLGTRFAAAVHWSGFATDESKRALGLVCLCFRCRDIYHLRNWYESLMFAFVILTARGCSSCCTPSQETLRPCSFIRIYSCFSRTQSMITHR
jgi:hypothetical protein